MSAPTHDWHCWDLARAASAHYAGDNRLHADRGQAHEIYQTSTMSALLAAVYDGTVTYGEIARHGDFGVGTFNGLDGEMVAADGQFFHLHSDGTATVADPTELTPFAVVTFFRGDAGRQVDEAMSRQELEATVDELVSGQPGPLLSDQGRRTVSADRHPDGGPPERSLPPAGPGHRRSSGLPVHRYRGQLGRLPDP